MINLNITFTLSKVLLQKHLTTLLSRYKTYEDEQHKPQSFHVELLLAVCGTKNITASDKRVDEFIQTLAFIDFTFEDENAQYAMKLEFLQHKDHFHPTFSQWYYCQDTTVTEVVFVLGEILKTII